jgi:pyruvate/2-oxoglutarate dehydrogenase complex dihydrolipoamide acyltransferase (E2) component
MNATIRLVPGCLSMKNHGKYSIESFPRSRIFTIDIGVLGSRRHHVKALLEFDVTKAREKIRAAMSAGNVTVSFTSWIVKCMATALDENRHIHALRYGRRKRMIFEDVDMSVMIEKDKGDHRVPVPYVIREANRKTISQIHDEIEFIKNADAGDREMNLDYTHSAGEKFLLALPQFIRLFAWKLMLRNPARVKKIMGTCLMTSVGMFGSVPGWAIPFSIHPVSFTLGSIVPRAVLEGGSLKNHDILHMTILFDHDVVDGAPAARFAAHLKELLESAHGL